MTPRELIEYIVAQIPFDVKLESFNKFTFHHAAARPTMRLLDNTKLKNLGMFNMTNWKDSVNIVIQK